MRCLIDTIELNLDALVGEAPPITNLEIAQRISHMVYRLAFDYAEPTERDRALAAVGILYPDETPALQLERMLTHCREDYGRDGQRGAETFRNAHVNMSPGNVPAEARIRR